MADAMTLTAYAARRGCSVMSVSRAIRDQRLTESVGRDQHNRPTIVDPDLADREWAQNTRERPAGRPARQGATTWQSGSGNHGQPTARVGSIPAPDTSSTNGTSDDEVPNYNESRARKEAASARKEKAAADMAELDLAERRGELVPAEDAKAEVIAAYTIVRTRVLGVPTRVAQRMPHLAGEVVPVIDELLREALEELAVDGRSA